MRLNYAGLFVVLFLGLGGASEASTSCAQELLKLDIETSLCCCNCFAAKDPRKCKFESSSSLKKSVAILQIATDYFDPAFRNSPKRFKFEQALQKFYADYRWVNPNTQKSALEVWRRLSEVNQEWEQNGNCEKLFFDSTLFGQPLLGDYPFANFYPVLLRSLD